MSSKQDGSASAQSKKGEPTRDTGTKKDEQKPKSHDRIVTVRVTGSKDFEAR